MKRSLVSWLLLAALLIGCRGDAVTTVAPAAAPPTPTPILDTPEAIASAFLAAWERGDAEGMYALLSPSSRAAASSERFAARMESTLRAATVLTATAALQAVLQEGDHAQAAYRLTWETALVGTLVTDTVATLALYDGRWWMEGTGDLIWPGLGEGNYLSMDYQIPARANIYDRNGLALAADGIVVTLGVVPGQIRDEAALLAALSLVTGMSPEAIQAEYAGHPADWWVPIADVSAQVSTDHAELLYSISGIEAREKEGRTYWDAGVGPHLVGWVSLIPAEEEQAFRALGYRGDEWVGVSGIEAWAEHVLAGRHGGTLYLLNSVSQPISELAHREAVPNRAVYTTFDREFQQQVQRLLGDRKGAIVVLDVQSGAVRALASGPSFDPNVFVGAYGAAERNAVLADSRHPLINRATQGLYPPGSVFKIVTTAAALEAGNMTALSGFWCPGFWEGLGPDARKGCWKEEGHQAINLKDALTASCDVTFYAIGQALDGIDQSILPTYGAAFGLGRLTGVAEIPELAGIMPGPEWKMAEYAESWWVGDSVNLSIGQGYLLVTPLQVAEMMVAVANGGTLYRPYLVERIAAAGEAYPEIVSQAQAAGTLPVSPENLAIIQEALARVTTSSIGTAPHRFVGLRVPVAGKTGTAEAPGIDSLPHSWFAAYAPADAPEIAIVVMVENAGEGSQVAAPLVRQVVEAYYGLPITPLPPVPTPTPAAQ